MKIIPEAQNTPEFFGLLTSAIAPRPIAMVSTVDKQGNVNLSPFSFFNVFSSNPAMVVFSPARSGRDNSLKDTYLNVKEVPECVVNVVNYEMVEQTSLSSSAYEKGVNEFVKAGFIEEPSDLIRPPRIACAPVQLECIVKQVIELGEQGGAGNLVLAEIKTMHIKEEILDTQGAIDANKLRLVGRMGKNLYVKAFGEALFTVDKPSRPLGIGVDAVPVDIQKSKVLTGNDLGKLGNSAVLPDETEVNEYKLIELSDLFMELEDQQSQLEEQLHQRAHKLLLQNKVHEAWMTLLSFNN